MKKNLSLFLVLLMTAVMVQASKARQAALGGAHAAPVEGSLSATIDAGDEKGFAAALKRNQDDQELTKALQNAAAKENLKYLNALIKEKKNAAELIKKDSSIFFVAMAEGSLKQVQILEKIANVAELKFEKNTNALQQAVQFAGADTIRYIADKYSALVSALDEQGESILFLAVRRGDRQIVDEVLKIKNLPVVKANKKGQTAQALALELGYKRIAEKVK